MPSNKENHMSVLSVQSDTSLLNEPRKIEKNALNINLVIGDMDIRGHISSLPLVNGYVGETGMDSISIIASKLDQAIPGSTLAYVKENYVASVNKNKEEVKTVKTDRFIKLQDFYFSRFCSLAIICVGVWLILHNQTTEGIGLTVFGSLMSRVSKDSILSFFSKLMRR